VTVIQEQTRKKKAGRSWHAADEMRHDGRLFWSLFFRRPTFDNRMLERLKSLPLTIVLTLLIWMYAESQVGVRSDSILTLPAISVWVSGPPQVLAQYDVKVDPQTVSVSVTGTPAQIKALRRVSAGQTGIHAYLDITEDDRPTAVYVYRQVRYVTPQGIAANQPPESVGFRLVPKAPPATGAATNDKVTR
jgi:hypothetical protein